MGPPGTTLLLMIIALLMMVWERGSLTGKVLMNLGHHVDNEKQKVNLFHVTLIQGFHLPQYQNRDI